MSKREVCLLAVACTFVGITIGFLLAPIKAGLSIGNNNKVLAPGGKRGGRAAEDEGPEDPCGF